MARDLMPKSGIVMPHIVITRDAAVVGVSTVDGKAGAVTLTGTYAKITDVYKKTETYSQDEVDNLIEPIMQRAMFKDDPYIDNNTALRSGGANGITSIDLIKASTDNSIHIGDLAAGAQGIHLYSEGKIDVAYKDANGDDAVSPLYSQRYRPPTADLPFAVVGTYVTDSKGRTISVTKDGNNSDIKKLNALTDVKATTVTFEKSPIVPTPVNPTEAATKAYVDAAVQSSGSGGYVGETFWHPSRVNLPGGTAPGDGQLISGASTLYPDLVALVQAGKLPNTTETTWQAQPTARAAYVYDSVADTLRMPDLNGVQTGSIKAPVMRGDGGGLAPGIMQKSGVPNVAGEISGVSEDSAPLWNTAVLKPPFKLGGVANKPLAPQGINSDGTDRILLIDLSTSSDVYTAGLTEARMNSVVGCYVIRVAVATQNGGDVDMLELQAQVEALRTAAIATNDSLGFAIIDMGSVVKNQQYTKINPFGNNTPVSVVAQVQLNGVWGDPNWIYNSNSSQSYGVRANYIEGTGIVVQTGTISLGSGNNNSGTGFPPPGSIPNETTSIPCRVLVWSVGKDISKLKQISQIDPVLIQEFKAPIKPTGFRQIWGRTTSETGGNGTNLTFSESILGQKVYMVAETANRFSLALDVPAKAFPASTTVTIPGMPVGSFTVAAAVDNASWLIGISPDGLTGKVVATTIALLNLYVDDYSVQP